MMVTNAVPDTPAVVAVMVTGPPCAVFASAVTKPVAALTLATAGWSDVQTKLEPLTGFPFASNALAESIAVSPSAEKPTVLGDTATEETTWATVIVAVPWAVPVLAVMVADPLPTAVTRPVASTVATLGADDIHVKV